MYFSGHCFVAEPDQHTAVLYGGVCVERGRRDEKTVTLNDMWILVCVTSSD